MSMRWLLGTVVLVAGGLAGCAAAGSAAPDMPLAERLDADASAAAASGNPLVLYFAAASCFYCRDLESAVLLPLIHSGDHAERLLIRRLDLDRSEPLRGLDGERLTPQQLADAYGVLLTPTIVFVDPAGRELAGRLIGVGPLDFYEARLMRSVEGARRRLALGDGGRSP